MSEIFDVRKCDKIFDQDRPLVAVIELSQVLAGNNVRRLGALERRGGVSVEHFVSTAMGQRG